ncbi:hypothetical protein M5C96_08220 [Acidovorax sp. GBBC 1281]|uniref:hypothetical protein n=1 Tax=unclassified Acidovorax TaxID=2684926 RepID=UPI0023498E79|nr:MULTISPECIES: hypothetical protein [unclassified Acidovorax]WCM99386.1 hypothetical protein M5C96_08220 [Acidovorax sp. GBBC 1281]
MPDAPRAVVEAIEAVGAQVKEHRSGIDNRLDGLQANLQQMEQVMAKLETNGVGPGSMRPPQAVSAQVLVSCPVNSQAR